MGCDGGTIPKRDELVKTKKKPEQKDKSSDLSFRWGHCTLTQEALTPPIVACEMGRLYSKESLILALLDKNEKLLEVAPHIRTLKDVKVLSLTENPDFKETSVRGENGDAYIDVQKAKFICPLSAMEMNGRFRFCFLWSCGCVLAEKALKEMKKLKEEGNTCPVCQKEFKFLDMILLNPSEEKDVDTLKEKMTLRRVLAKEGKKKGKKSATATSTTTSESSVAVNVDVAVKRESSSEGPEGRKKTKLIHSSKSAVPAPVPVPVKAGTSGYSVAEDPRASEVYKSLFTTHSTAASQERAHWITYNPFYN